MWLYDYRIAYRFFGCIQVDDGFGNLIYGTSMHSYQNAREFMQTHIEYH